MKTIKAVVAVFLLIGLIAWVNSRESDDSNKPLVPGATALGVGQTQDRGDLRSGEHKGRESRNQAIEAGAPESDDIGGKPEAEPVELRPITVQVVDDLDTPIAAAQVWIHGSTPEVRTSTDRMGGCTLELPVTLNKPVVRAEAAEHLPEWQAVRFEQSALRIRLPRMRDVFGSVVRAHDGLPVVGASVLPVFYGGSPEDAALVPIVTDDAGRFGPLSVPTGRMFILRAERDGFRSVGKRVTVGDVDSESLPAVELEFAWTVKLHVFEAESGQPIEGVELVAMGGVKESAHTDELGIGVLERVFAEGDVERGVRISTDGRCAVIARLTRDLVAEGSAIQIPLYPECFVRGRTLDTAGKVVGGVRLRATFDLGEGVPLQRNPGFPNKQLVPGWPGYVEWDPGDWVLEATSDEDGNYSIGNLAPGLVGVSVFNGASRATDPGAFVAPGPRVPGDSAWIDVVIE